MADQRMIGEILSERRAQLRLSVERVASDTKLQPRVIAAFENSDFDAMPPKGYAQATLASYARYLDLDPDDVLPVYEAQLRRHQREADAAARTSERSATGGSSGSPERRRSGSGASGSRSGSARSGRYSYSYASSAPGAPEADGTYEDGSSYDEARPSARGGYDRERGYGASSRGGSSGSSRRSSTRSSGLYDSPSSYHRDRTRDDYGRSEYADASGYGTAGRSSYDDHDRDEHPGSGPSSRAARGTSGFGVGPTGRQTEVVTLDDGYEGGSGGSRAVHRGTSVHGGHPTSEVEPRATITENLMGLARGISAYFRENRQLALIVGGVVAALILVLIIFGITSCVNRPSGGDGTIPVTPLGGSSASDGTTTTDGGTGASGTPATQGTTGTDATGATTQGNVPLDTGPSLTMLPANSVVNFFVSLDATVNPWIEVNVDGSIVYAEQSKPGSTMSFVITRTATITVSNPELVSLSVNGTPAQTTSSNGTNVLTLAVDPTQQPPADAQPADANANADDAGTDGGGEPAPDDGSGDASGGDASQHNGTYAGMEGIEILHDEWGGAYYLDQNGDPNYYYDDGTPVG